MEYRGRIARLFPVESGTTKEGKEWEKQEFVFEYFEHDNDRWSDRVLLSIMNDKIKQYALHENDEVIIGFGHSTREYNGRIYNEIRLYKCEKVLPVASTNKSEVDTMPNLPM